MWAVSSTNFSPPRMIVRFPVFVTWRFPSMTITVSVQTCVSVTIQSPGVGRPERSQFWAAAGRAGPPPPPPHNHTPHPPHAPHQPHPPTPRGPTNSPPPPPPAFVRRTPPRPPPPGGRPPGGGRLPS